MKLFPTILLPVFMAGMTCNAMPIQYYNELFMEEGLGGSVIPGEYHETTGISFMPSLEGGWWPEAEYASYSVNLDVEGDSETAEPSIFVLETITLQNVTKIDDEKDETGIWGLILDADGVLLAASHASYEAAGSITFNFSDNAPQLDIYMWEEEGFTPYTLTFVISNETLEQLKIGLPYEGSRDSLCVMDTGAIEYSEYPVCDDDGNRTGVGEYTDTFVSSDYLGYVEDEGEYILRAPAVSIMGYAIAVPEPATVAMSLLALCGLAARRRRCA